MTRKTRKPLAEGEYASKKDHFLHLLNSIFVFGRKPLAEDRELTRASRNISFIISFKCVALTKYCTSSQGHHGTFDMKQIPKEPNINYGLHAWQNIKRKYTFRMCRQFLCEGWSHNQVSWLCDVPRLESIKKFWIISSSVERPEAKHPSEFFHCKNIFFQTNLKRHIVRFCHCRKKRPSSAKILSLSISWH